MMKNRANKNKVKLPKIEINECKVKTRDPKKLEAEMINQAKEAKMLLEKLLAENKDMVSRTRSASLNASVENLILSNRKKFKMFKARGSVPNIGNISKKLLFGQKATIADCHSQPVSPTMSPGASRRNQFIINPIKFVRRFNSSENSERDRIIESPLTKGDKDMTICTSNGDELNEELQNLSTEDNVECNDASSADANGKIVEKLI